MPNVLLTYRCNQKCPYCFAKDKKGNIDLSLKNLQTILDFLKKNKTDDIRLLGGEPTCHPKFKKIINELLRQNFKVHLFTNGLFSENILNFLKSHGRSITYNFNINEKSFYNVTSWKKIKHNFSDLNKGQLIIITFNIFRCNFISRHLVEILASNRIDVLQIRITNPILNQGNVFLPADKYKAVALRIKEMLEYLDTIRTIKPFKVVFGCGFSKPAGRIIKKIKTGGAIKGMEIRYGCFGNTGKFDITPDLKVFRCLPLASWKTKSLSNFKTSGEINKYYNQEMEKAQNEAANDYLKNGPCFSYLLAKSKIPTH